MTKTLHYSHILAVFLALLCNPSNPTEHYKSHTENSHIVRSRLQKRTLKFRYMLLKLCLKLLLVSESPCVRLRFQVFSVCCSIQTRFFLSLKQSRLLIHQLLVKQRLFFSCTIFKNPSLTLLLICHLTCVKFICLAFTSVF